MAFPVVMLVRDTDAPRIERVWHILAARNFSDDQIRFNYPPHVSIALFDDDANPDLVIERVARASKDWKPFPVIFDSVAFLPRPVAPLLLRPNVTLDLLRANAEICGSFKADAVLPSSKPGAWQPHATGARDIKAEDRGAALSAVLDEWAPFETQLDRIALLHTRQDGPSEWQVKELWRHHL